MLGSFAPRSASHDSNGSQPSLREVPAVERKLTRCRSKGESSGKSAGGGRGEMKAVGRHASNGGRSSLVSGGGWRCIVVFEVLFKVCYELS